MSYAEISIGMSVTITGGMFIGESGIVVAKGEVDDARFVSPDEPLLVAVVRIQGNRDIAHLPGHLILKHLVPCA